MKRVNQDPQSKAPGIGYIEHGEVNSFNRWIMPEVLKDLEDKVNRLPKVDEKGRSECPEAEDMYAEKNEAVEKCVKYLKKGKKYVIFVEWQLASNRRNLSRIKAGHSKLDNTQAKEEYRTAIENCTFHFKKYSKRLKNLRSLISKANKLLKKAREKKWPLGKPEKKFRPPPLMAGRLAGGDYTNIQGPSPVIPVQQRPALNTEINSLMSLGPLGNKKN